MPRREALHVAGRLLVLLAGTAALTLAPRQEPAVPLAGRVRIGAYLRPAGRPPADPVAPQDLAALEAALGRRLDIVHYFWEWGRPFTDAVTGNLDGRDLLLSWKPSGDVVRQIPGGAHDPYIDAFARQAAALPRPVHLRFAWEMNGDWMDYSAGAGGPSAEDYVDAWRHLVTRFRAAGADAVRFVWCPNERDFPDRPGNHLEDYWPGAAWVDVLGFDAYNWSARSPARGDGTWRSFDQLVAEPYQRLTALSPDIPVWLCEWGTTEATDADPAGASKAQWFSAAGAVPHYPRLAALIYFSEDDQRDTQRDWRLDTSAASARAFGLAFPAPRAPTAAGAGTDARPDPTGSPHRTTTTRGTS